MSCYNQCNPCRNKSNNNCNNLALTITTSATSVVVYIFNIVNNGPRTVTDVTLTLTFTGDAFSIPGQQVGDRYIVDIGTLEPNEEIIPPVAVFAINTSSSITGIITSSSRICNRNNSIATASFP